MDRFVMLLLTLLGVACIWAGYKLFCGLPAITGHSTRATRAGVVLFNVIPGVLLALIGTGVITAEAHGILAHKPAMQNRQPATDRTTWHHNPGFLYRNHAA